MTSKLDVHVYTTGLVHCSICVPKGVSLREAVAYVNRTHSTGIASTWNHSRDKHFASGELNPCPCETERGRTHYLLVC